MVAMTAVSELVARWAHFYGQTRAVSATVTYVHLVGILAGGGVAIATDVAALRLSPGRVADWPAELDRLAAVHLWVVLLLTQLDTFASSGVFWTKMGLVALLIGNGYARLRCEIALRQGTVARWSWFRRTSIASLALWFVILLFGALLHSTV